MKKITNKITWKKVIMVLVAVLFIYCLVYFGIKLYNNSKHFKVETTISLDQYDIAINENTIVYNESDSSGSVIIIKEDDEYSLRLSGEANRNYEFTIEDENGNTNTFEYSFDDKKNLSLREK